MNTPPTLAIVGAGKLARTLARLWHTANAVVLQDVLNRSPKSARNAIGFIGTGTAINEVSQLRRADIVLIATPDDQIHSVCERLAASVPLEGSIVFHCSGALPSSILEPARAQGATIASIHPVRSFARPEEMLHSFVGTWCGVEGDRQAIDALQPLFAAIGAHFVDIDPQRKTLYHAAAVFASNYLVTLLDTAVQAYSQAGVPRNVALKMMAPLVRETVENVLTLGTEQALTGPIARGDVKTVLRQYRAARSWDKRYGDLYRKLGKLTVAMVRRRRNN
ncbi:MAG TPA: DUF2520 domain-containing protein [Oxalicibacterium sp.]|jgi:predicted short-subunit dehydrogenase-like oxidoreductase (DUF2520 family)|nr:DUF2520 domain-containing protein [Oxalicibacterium sp.]